MTAPQTIFCLALATFCGAGAGVGTRADDLAVRHAIESAHVRQVRADTGGDAARWRQMYQNLVTPDFTVTLMNGEKLNREQFQEDHTRSLEKGGQEAFHIQRVKRTGNRATEEGFITYHMTHLVTGRNTYRAGWVKVGASWKLADLHLLKHEEQTRGKPSGV